MTYTTLHDLLKSLARRGPQPAFVHRTEVRRFVWSYGQVYQGAQQVAAYLASQGLRSGDRAVLWLPNSPYWVMAFFGCLRAGVVAVPIDPRSTPEFARGVLSQVEARLVFRSRYRPAPDLPVPTCFVEDMDAILTERLPPPPDHPVAPETVAEIVYTSGTTGTPKGVVLTHGNLAANLTSLDTALPQEPELRLLSLLPLSHTFEQQVGLFFPLARGGQVVYLETLKPSALLEALSKESIVLVVAVPRLLQMLMDQLTREIARLPGGSVAFRALDSIARRVPFQQRRLLFWAVHHRLGGRLKYLVSGGAPLDPGLEREWEQLGVSVLQGYGLTEASPVVACNVPDAERTGSVGRLLPGVEVRIAPDGEVLVRGPNIMAGYYCQPAQTAEVLHGGWLHTGDLGHFDADGFLYIDGRKKEVIVTPEGVNVFPEDVERALDQQPGVRASCVVGWQGRVFAVLLPADRPALDPGRAVAAANRLLPPSQHIRGYVVWPFHDFPRTPLLKVHRAQVLASLPQLLAGQLRAPPAGVREPLTSVRRVIAHVAGVPVSQVRPEATLGVDLGLGSVERLEVVALLEEELNVEIEEEALTSETRVRDLERMAQEAPPPGRRIRLRRWTRWRPVSLLREGFWLLALFPAIKLVCRPLHIEGRENLEGLQGPAIFLSNHTSYLDAPVILLALPPRFRSRIAPAAWAEFFEAPLGRPLQWLVKEAAYQFVSIFFNVFLVPHRRGFRASLRYAGELVDEGWNLLFFPEGAMTLTGQMNPFQEGTGLFVSRLKVPVVPVKVEGLFHILPPHTARLRPGPAAVKFGRPIWVRAGSYLEITRQIEAAVRSL